MDISKKKPHKIDELGPPMRSIKTNGIVSFVRLGKEIKISPKAHATIENSGSKYEFFTETVSVLIGIGNDHTATLIMDIDAWRALNAGEKVDITTTKEYEEQYVKPLREIPQKKFSPSLVKAYKKKQSRKNNNQNVPHQQKQKR